MTFVVKFEMFFGFGTSYVKCCQLIGALLVKLQVIDV